MNITINVILCVCVSGVRFYVFLRSFRTIPRKRCCHSTRSGATTSRRRETITPVRKTVDTFRRNCGINNDVTVSRRLTRPFCFPAIDRSCRDGAAAISQSADANRRHRAKRAITISRVTSKTIIAARCCETTALRIAEPVRKSRSNAIGMSVRTILICRLSSVSETILVPNVPGGPYRMLNLDSSRRSVIGYCRGGTAPYYYNTITARKITIVFPYAALAVLLSFFRPRTDFQNASGQTYKTRYSVRNVE